MEISIQNEYLTASFKKTGAELCSLKSRKIGIEHLWQADPEIWKGHAPVLFPIVGRLKNDEYVFKGKTYKMPQHGFARKMDFEIINSEADRISFLLKSDESTLAVYPFHFELSIHFRLEKNTLITEYEVKNASESEMYFSIGAHPGFNCELHLGEKRSDYKLKFNKAEKLERHHIEAGLYTGETSVVLNGSSSELPITDDLFKKDALVFKHMQSDEITLLNKQNQPEVSVSFKGFPYLGLWTQAAVPGVPPYVCIEPWFGLADSIAGQSDLSDKEGVIELGKGNSFRCRFDTQVYNV